MSIWTIKELDEASSTNTLAKELMQKGKARHGDVLQARHQTAGRGRIGGRIWHDEPDQSLLMSIVLERVPARPELLQYVSALSVLSALRRISAEHKPATPAKGNARFRLKWPNDILLGNRKVCGILTEAIWHGDELRAAIVGIGVNVLQREFDEPLNEIATSLLQCGMDVSVSLVRDAILASLEHDLDRYNWQHTGAAQHEIVAQMRKELHWMISVPPMNVRIGEHSSLHEMCYEGLTDTGSIMMRHPDGKKVTLHGGSLEWAAKRTGLTPEDGERLEEESGYFA